VEPGPWSCRRAICRRQHVTQFPQPLGRQQANQVVPSFDVKVERRRPHIEPPGKLAHREPFDATLLDQLAGRGGDRFGGDPGRMWHA